MVLPEVDELYKFIKEYHEKENLNNVQSINQFTLNVTLRPYQCKAVEWMIYREKCENLMIDGQLIELPPGGILADEMGLGKTIEVLACILNNPSDIKPLEARKKRKKTRKRKVKMLESGDENDMSDESEEILPKKTRIDLTIESVISNYCHSVNANNVNTISNEQNKKPPRKVTGLKQEKYVLLRKWYEDELSSLSFKSKGRARISSGKQKPQCYCTKPPTDNTTAICNNCGVCLHLICVGIDYEIDEDCFYCPECWTKHDPVPSRATFIITPNTIFDQWISEINKHVKDKQLKILLYDGVKGNKYIQPEDLANNDIVITTYQILLSELNYTDIEEAPVRQLRYAKKFYTAKSPLPCVRWWRLCLDEAQMVEGVASKLATMAKHLQAVNKWAVTGTPIQKSVNDLLGLVQFLQITPYSKIACWNRLVENKSNLFALLGRVLWRSNKIDVYHMLGVPDQTVVTHWLRFSPIEGYFYQRMHRECAGKFRDKLFRLNDLDLSLKVVDRKLISKLMIPLVKLRQACIHPQVVRGRLVNNSNGKHMMTMDELMTQMITKAKLDVEGALRTVVSCCNGIAALKILLGEWSLAANQYRLVLQFAEEFENLATIDTLQMIHTLYNLAEVINEHRSHVSPTLRDEKLLEDAYALEKSFLEKYDKKLLITRTHVAKNTALVAEQARGKTLGYSSWWEDVLRWCTDRKDLIDRIQSDLENNRTPGQASIAHKLKSITGIHKEIAIWLASIDSLRLDVITALRRLELVPKIELAMAASDCHLYVKKKNRKNINFSCHLCCVETTLKKYEASIFSINKQNLKNNNDDDSDDTEDLDLDNDNKVVAGLKEVKIHTTKKESSWKPSQQERILKVLSTYARLKKQLYSSIKTCCSEWIEDSINHLQLLKTVRKEFKSLRAEWSCLSHTVNIRDELAMAKLRLRLPTPLEETESKNKKTNLDSIIVRPVEIPAQLSKFEWDCADSLVKLRKKAGVLQYLQNLKKNGSVSQEACPVCHEQLNDKWSVMECGHCVCFQCIPTLLDMGTSCEVECPLCRMRTRKSDLSYVVANRETSSVLESGSGINVKGSYSTKVEAVTAQLLQLRQNDPDVKVLIFSTWEKVLDLLCDALEKNEISFRRFSSLSKFNNGLQQFKTKHITALLLPLRLGAKGLNIVEATHVFLVEPILNPADELQAAGRVHRIGQTKATYVHRFVIENTIEERIVSSLKDVNSEKNITLKQLDDLFRLASTKES